MSKIDDERELMLVAFIDGKHIGNCSLMSIAPYKVNMVFDSKDAGCGEIR